MFTLSTSQLVGATRQNVRSQQNKSRKSVVVSAGLTPEKLKATGKRLLVIPDQEEATTAGGILLMSSSANAGPGSSICGSVSSVGAECKTVKQGDSVLINGFAGSEIEFEDGSKGKFVTEDDVLAILS
jgi:chaperonin GroES